MASAVRRAPPRAKSEMPVSLMPSSTMATTADALAPEEIPMMSGEASGLRSIVWNVAPARPNAVPARTAVTVRGSRSSPTVNDAPGTVSPRITRITWTGE